MVGRAGEAQGGACVPPSLAKQREHYHPFASDSITSSPLETHPPFSLSPVPRTLSSFCCLSCCLPRASRLFSTPLFFALSEPRRRSSPVPSLRLRFPRLPSFLYTTSFTVVGEGETPAFAVGEAVLFFPLIKADRCGSGCRDDGTGGRWREVYREGSEGREETETMG